MEALFLYHGATLKLCLHKPFKIKYVLSNIIGL